MMPVYLKKATSQYIGRYDDRILDKIISGAKISKYTKPSMLKYFKE